MRNVLLDLVVAAALSTGTASAMAQTTLRIGLQEDIGSLDPARSSQVVDRMVLRSLCSSLVDIGTDLKFVPMLATAWNVSSDNKTWTFKLRKGVKFHDDEPFNAAAVKANLDRARSMPASNRKSELSSIDHIDVVDDTTVNIVLKTPDSALLATLSDRAGMMLAPKSLKDDAAVQSHPVCSGPYKFVQRVQNDRVVLEKFAGFWEADKYPIQKVVYLPIPDTTVRLANVRSGSLDMLERLSPSDVKSVKRDTNLTFISMDGLGYYGLTFNVAANANKALRDKRVRQAFDLSIDREAINQVIGGGIFTPANQALPRSGQYYDTSIKTTKRDVAKAKALLKSAGFEKVDVTLSFGNNTVSNQMAQMLQAMLADSGITLKLRPMDYAAALDAAHRGDFDVLYNGWSGRVDPDGNLHQFVSCKGNLNYGQYCNAEVDRLLGEARVKSTVAERKPLYDAANKILSEDDPILYLYVQPWPYVLTKKVQGFVAYPDGLIRLRGVSLKG
ncbi:ABC transporter substrate-binding protein [Pandoraea faecigallinarum]|uniref:ABC transporter substrate-binding protein n=1 Tax=Pandoraea faecigallinarum TaxID=656179 RepID=A0A0H3WUN3_9BURK|nr:ABC transporter substrate-binding protein [Pandoraea faecigallinarum]AKM31345.1 ABC transporter substrate-binding protein [Pandoraea faecigallinarum]